jgi:hypothetical protein
MLQAKRIPQLLQGGLGDGICALVLMTSEGSILSSQSTNTDVSDILLGAVSSLFWTNTSKNHSDIQLHIMRLEKATIGVASAGRGYLIAAYGDDTVSTGFLKARLDAMRAHLNRVFEQLT